MNKEFLEAFLPDEAIPDTITAYTSLTTLQKIVTDEAKLLGSKAPLGDVFDNAKKKFEQKFGKGYFVATRRCMLWNAGTVPQYVPYNQWRDQTLNFDVPLLLFGNIGYGEDRRYTHFARSIFLGNVEEKLKEQYAELVKDHNETLMENVIPGKTLYKIYTGFKGDVKKSYESRQRIVPIIHRVLSGIGAKPNVGVWGIRDGGRRTVVMQPRLTLATNLVYEYTDPTSRNTYFLAHGDTVVTYSNAPAQPLSAFIAENSVLDESTYEDLESTLVIEPEDDEAFEELPHVDEEPEEEDDTRQDKAKAQVDTESGDQLAGGRAVPCSRNDRVTRATAMSGMCYGSNRPNKSLESRVVAAAKKTADLEQSKQKEQGNQRYGIWQ